MSTYLFQDRIVQLCLFDRQMDCLQDSRDHLMRIDIRLPQLPINAELFRMVIVSCDFIS